MSFVFKENFTVSLPQLESYQEAGNFTESVDNVGLIVEIAAIHAGYTENHTYYSADELRKAASTWVNPYPKPVIMNHDVTTEPVGRIVGAKMDAEENGKEYIRIQAAITDPEAIKKVMDKRYMTGSIGGKADVALCSICRADWATLKEGSLPCRHRRGKVYDGSIAVLEFGGLSFKEYSFVNVPADTESYIRSIKTAEQDDSDDTWAKPSKFFIFSLDDRKVTEFSKDNEHSSFIIGESETKFLYDIIDLDNKNHKSLFVNNDSTVNTNENVQSLLLQELNMQNQEAEIDQEDILAVTEQLTEDLSVDHSEAVVEETDTAVVEDEAPVEEETVEETQTAEVEEEAPVEDQTETEEETETEVVAEVEETEVEAEEETQDGLVTQDSVEPELVTSLQEQLTSLQEENTKLKEALHRTLAERVVDAKISLGIEESANRVVAITEHSERSASSLADSLRDLASMPITRQAVVTQTLDMVVESAAVEDEGESAVTLNESEIVEEEQITETPKTIFVEKMVEVLSGKSQLH